MASACSTRVRAAAGTNTCCVCVQGVCITLCSRSKEDRVPWIEKKAGFSFERIGPPQPKEMATVAAARAVDAIVEVSDAAVPGFSAAAAELLQREPDAHKALAKALAKLTGAPGLQRLKSCGRVVWVCVLVCSVSCRVGVSCGRAF